MAYDRELAERVRLLLADEADVSEKAMFGGLAFLVGGNLAVAASGQGGLLVRVDPAESAVLQAETGARPMEMRGKAMTGWLRVEAAVVEDDEEDELGRWVRRGVAFARSLPAKPR